MADIRSSQYISQVEYQLPGAIKASQVVVQVEYVPPPYGTYTGHITIEFIPDSEEISEHPYSGDIPTSFIPEATTGLATDFVGDITISFVPESEGIIAQSYVGDISVSFIPESEIVGDQSYEGSVITAFIPEAICRVPIPGFDWFTGYGLVDLTFLDGEPPFYVYRGEIEAIITLDAAQVGYAEYSTEGSGGLGLSGEGVFAYEKPATFAVAGSGGFKISGIGTKAFESPSTLTVVASGGMIPSGVGVVVFVDAPTIPEYAVTGSGGLLAGGFGTLLFPRPKIPYATVGAGGIRVSGNGTVSFIDISEFIYTVVGSGGVELNGAGETSFVIVNDVFSLVGSGGLKLAGAGLIARLSLSLFSVIGSGGVILSGIGSHEEFVYQTWVFTGADFKPSIYSGYNFNSYCKHGEKYYGINDEGIFELSGDSDNGGAIHTGVKIGATNLGSLLRKRIRTIFIGAYNEDAQVKVEVGRKNRIADRVFTMNRGKASVSRDLHGEEFTLYISDFEEISTIEIFPTILNARGK